MNIFFGSDALIGKKYLEKANDIINSISEEFILDKHDLYSIWIDNNQKGETIRYEDEKYEIIFDGYLNNINGSLLNHLPLLARRIINKGTVLSGEETGIFNIVIIDKVTHNIFLASDPSALFPLYYIMKNNQFYFFSHMYIFSEALGQEPDLIGILTKIKFGYTFGSRTLYQSVSRINPGEIIEFNTSNEKILIHRSEEYYSQYKEFGKDLEEIVWDCLSKPYKTYPNYSKKIGIMLSEGFDSRLVAGLASKSGLRVSMFTHGTPGTKGANITFSVSEFLSAEYFFDPLNDGLPSDGLEIKKQLYLSDNLSIPYWIYGSGYFGNSTVDFVSAGTALDSTLGGHPFFRPTRPRNKAIFQRYCEIIGQDLGLIEDKYIEDLSTELLDISRMQCISKNLLNPITSVINKDRLNTFLPYIDNVIEDYDEEIKRLSVGTSCLPSQILQKFFLENRARKFSFGQELTLRINNKVVVPSYEPVTMRILSAIHPKYKLQHKLYLSFTRKYFPKLFGIPNGGFSLPTYYPRLLLESSRFIHKYFEEKLIRKYIEKNGEIDIHNLRSVNFIEATYRKGQAINFFINYFNEHNNIFNSKQLIANLQKVQNFQSKSFQLMESYKFIEIQDPLARLV